MILGESTEIRPKKAATKYVAIDCEMVGVGFEGQESSLARVSVVNFDGTVLLDEIVQQKERVVDYRTQYSGIRPTDMVNAKLFADVQNRVAKLLEGKVLVGHAVWNDLKALLLSHPRYLIRDTQVLAAKHKVVKSPRPALRHLVAHEFGMAFHTGEHSSITDARATMAIFRLHRKVWETGLPRIYQQAASLKKLLNVAPAETSELLSDDEDAKTSTTDAKAPTSKKRKAEDASAETAKVILQAKKRAATFPGGGRKGVSSGLSTVVKHKDKGASWWKELK
ncbi:RNA exonuclease 4 like domain-containing protein [Phanerochaete sordida]|uniref:RNA exonuclease 4 n=1 Tax=Phanerochaete sordida TaxID=48140 RepID=A0A9P3LDF7_9APHY|nr:RNA exonuclease 4 like domain-containing protein [Phanerochaete sordida]